MKILFVFTGGTIGCTERGGVADVDSATAEKIASLCGFDASETEFAFPFNMLSENAGLDSLSKLLTFMLSIDYSKYTGVIVTHGSDTLAYSSSLLGTSLSWTEIPIVITAADLVMSDPRSNAKDNLRAAAAVIESQSDGVFVTWKNRGEDCLICRADTLLEADANDRFSCIGKPAGYFKDGRFSANYLYRKNSDLAFLKNRVVTLKSNVLLLHSFPGLDYGDTNIKGKEAVILKTYHSGTFCAEGSKTSLEYLARKCGEEGASLYLAPVKKGDYIYASSLNLGKSRAIPLCGASEIKAYTALLLAYSLKGEERSEVLRALSNEN